MNKLKVEQVAAIVGVSAKTINNWYWFKHLHPDNEYASKLPDYEQASDRSTRYWSMEDVYKLIEFRANLPHGRNGVLGDITQRYSRSKREEKKNGKKESRSTKS